LVAPHQILLLLAEGLVGITVFPVRTVDLVVVGDGILVQLLVRVIHQLLAHPKEMMGV
jgi:hypothetical protein